MKNNITLLLIFVFLILLGYIFIRLWDIEENLVTISNQLEIDLNYY